MDDENKIKEEMILQPIDKNESDQTINIPLESSDELIFEEVIDEGTPSDISTLNIVNKDCAKIEIKKEPMKNKMENIEINQVSNEGSNIIIYKQKDETDVNDRKSVTQISDNLNDQPLIKSQNEFLLSDAQYYEEVIVEEIIEIEEHSEPIEEICDEIETIEILKGEDDIDDDDDFFNEIEHKVLEQKLNRCHVLKKQFQQYKTYENKKKIKNQFLNNKIKNSLLEEEITPNDIDLPIFSENKNNTTCFTNYVDLQKTETHHTPCNTIGDICEGRIISKKDDPKNKIKIIQNQILNETIDIKNFLKLKKSDKKIIKPPGNLCTKESTSEKNQIISNSFEVAIKNNEANNSEIQSGIIAKPKIMEKVLWKNVSIGNEKKLVPISTAVKIVKIPKNAKVIKIHKTELTDQNILFVNKSNKNNDIKVGNTSQMTLTKQSNEIKTYKNKTSCLNTEPVDVKNKFNDKNIRVYHSPKSFVRSTNENLSLKVFNKNTHSMNKSHQTFEDANVDKILPKDYNSMKNYLSSPENKNVLDTVDIQKKRRGRPSKNQITDENDQIPLKRKRGRPPRLSLSTTNETLQPKSTQSSSNNLDLEPENFKSPTQVKKRRGRPPGKKNLLTSLTESDTDMIEEGNLSPENVQKKRRGRPPNKRKSFFYYENIETDDSKTENKNSSEKDLIEEEDSQTMHRTRRERLPKKSKNFYYEEVDEKVEFEDFKIEEENISGKEDLTKKESLDNQNVQKKRRGRPPKKREIFFEETDSTETKNEKEEKKLESNDSEIVVEHILTDKDNVA